jgi:hypothetical protein
VLKRVVVELPKCARVRDVHEPGKTSTRVGVGSRLPLDRTMPDPDVGVKPDGRIPASAVCPRGAHLVSVSSERTMGIIDGIVGFPRRIYVIRPLLA